MAAPITPPIGHSPNQATASSATTTAHSSPFNKAMPISLASSARALLPSTWPSAMPRITSVRVWLPAMPPMLATMGISTASATTRSSVVWNRPITHAARKAVTRLMPSHTARRRELVRIGANMSASSSRPAMCIIARSELSRIWSTTSSTVIRPSNRRSASTTGAESRSRSWNRWATSSADASTWMAGNSLSITSATLRFWAEVTSLLSRSTPWNTPLRSTTISLSVCTGSVLSSRR